MTFIGNTADDVTRTYTLEIQVNNEDYSVPSGISVQIDVPVERVMAQKVSPALFALDDDGRVGLRTIDAENRVVFHFVDVVADAADGVWVTGLPDVATIITVGQELVVHGELVDVVLTDPLDRSPAQSSTIGAL